MFSEFHSLEIYNVAYNLFGTILDICVILMLIPPKKYYCFFTPLLFATKFYSNTVVFFINNEGYYVQPLSIGVAWFIFYLVVLSYLFINYPNEKSLMLSWYCIFSLLQGVLSSLVSSLYSIIGIGDAILSIGHNTEIAILIEFVVYKVINAVVFLLPIYLVNTKFKFKFNPHPILKYTFIIMMFAMEIIGIVIMTKNAIETDEGFLFPVAIFVIFIPILIILFIMIFYIQNRSFKSETEFLKKQNALTMEYYGALENNQQLIRKISHDISNHIRTLQILSERNETKEFKEYADNLISSYSVPQVEYCENKIVNATILGKASLAKEKEIDFKADIKLPEKLEIEDTDIVSIFSNLLDNAIEACEKITDSKKFVSVSCSYSDGIIAVNCENSCSDEKSAKKLLSDKSDLFFHGIGTKIINNNVEKYNGSYTTEVNSNIFSAYVTLNETN